MSMQALPAGCQYLAELLDELNVLNEDVQRESAARLAPYRTRYPQGFSVAAHNLADYLALRNHDLRPLQERLVTAGLSSLGRGESQVRTNLARVIGMLGSAAGIASNLPVQETGAQYLERNTELLFGRRSSARHARIMVTLPGEAAARPELIGKLVENGMDCARINCAHDGPDTWQRMIDHVRMAECASGKPVRIFMDLAGHKIRTGEIRTGPAVMHLRVRRNDFGHVTAPARVLLTATVADMPSGSSCQGLPQLPVDAELLGQLRPLPAFQGHA